MGAGDEDCKTIPAINLQNFPDEEEYRKLREASETWGCFRLMNHRIPVALMSEMKCVVRSMLELPLEMKEQNKDSLAFTGYIPPSKLNPLFEAFGIYDLASPQAVHGFCSQLDVTSHQREVIEKYAQATCEQVVDIGKKLAESLGVANTDFHKGWPCQFRMNKYKFSPASMGSPGLQEHTDSGFLTILQEDEDVGGLEVMNKSGAFVPVHPCPGTLFINLGDFAQVWSNGRLHNVRHRVKCSEASIRVSIATFLSGPKEEAIEAPPELVDSDHPRLYVPFVYDDYRVSKFKLLKKLQADKALALLRIPS